MSFAETVTVALVACDEANNIARTLASVNAQEGDERYHFRVTVAANGCKDDTAERATAAIESFEPRPDISYRVKKISTPGKNNAINEVFADSPSRLGMYGDCDAVFSSNCFGQIVKTLEQPEVWASGPVSRQIIHPKLVGTELGNILRAKQLEIECSGNVPAPVGRLIGFRRELLDDEKIPLNALADERFITLTAIRRHGRPAVKTIQEASVFANAAQTVEDFRQTGDRIATVRKMFVAAYPELGALLHELTLETSRRAPPEEEVRRQVTSRLIEEGIDPACLDEWHRLRAAAKPRPELIRSDGTWQPTLSTK